MDDFKKRSSVQNAILGLAWLVSAGISKNLLHIAFALNFFSVSAMFFYQYKENRFGSKLFSLLSVVFTLRLVLNMIFN